MTEIPENLESERALHLIAKGREVFLKLGYRATTMRDIAQAAGMSRPAVYLVFANKDAVFRASFIRSMRRRLMQLREDIDPAWPLEIQRSWPYFIMGASQAWLMLVQELSAENELPGEVDYPSLLRHYQEVDVQLSAQWRENGQHAYLHHLNAIFGYQPLLVRSKELKTF